MNGTKRSRLYNLLSLALVMTLAMPWTAFASSVDVSVVDVLAPTGSVTLTPGGASGPITINLSITGNQVGTATFKVNRDWSLSNGFFTGSNPQMFTVPARNGGDSATTFSTTGSVSVAAGQGTGTFTLSVGVFDITNATQSGGGKLAAGNAATYAVTVSAPSPIATTTTVTCPASVTYTGAAQTPCTATVTGAGGLNQSLTVNYSNNTNAGTATASASFAGNGTYAASSDSKTFTIAKAASTVAVNCSDVTYTGAAQTPCMASYSGVGGVSGTLTPTYTNNTSAGTASASASYAGDANHNGSNGSATFAIAKASSSTSVTCPASVTYTGAAQTPCSASYSGVGGLSGTLTPTYSNNTSAGTASASASYAGDANHNGSSDSASFTIAKAASQTDVTCPTDSVNYTGTAQTPCSAIATGAGGLNVSVEVIYDNNTNAGTASASASYAGDANHTNSSNSTTFQIGTVGSTTTIDCPASVTYNGSAQTPCTANVTGVGGLNQSVTVVYTNNTNAGTATAKATFDGDGNHDGSFAETTFTIAKANATINVSGYTGEYDGAAHGATGSASGIGGENAGTLNLGASFTNVPGGTAQWTFTGNGNYNDASGDVAIEIAKADATISVSGYTGAYDGAAHGATGLASGIGGENAGTLNLGASFTDVPGGTAQWSFTGNGNYNDANGDAPIVITKAASTTTISCQASVVYSGAAQTPCSATATGAGGLNISVAVNYSNNTDAGAASVTATYVGDTNHFGSNDTSSFRIEQASSTVALNCPASVTYSGVAQTPCSAKATGAGGLDESVSVIYTNNTNAGTASAVASYSGDTNHTGNIDSTTFQIDKASSTTTVSCPASVTYNGAALIPCTAKVTGVGGLDQAVSVSYSGNLNAGTATASANYPGDDNHLDSSDSKPFTINPAAVTATAGSGSATYNGSAQTPSACVVSGAYTGDLSCTNNPTTVGPNAGTYAVAPSVSGTGLSNFAISSTNGSYTIAKAPSTVTVTCAAGPFYYTGAPITPACMATVTGAGGLNQVLSVSYSNNINVGTATVTANYGGDDNHLVNAGSTTFAISGWTLKGFYQPVDMGGVWNTVKNGSTVPLKFEVFAGVTELTDPSVVKSFTQTKVTCTTGSEDAIEEVVTTGGTSLRYDTTGGQFVQNWKTPAGAGTCYKVTMTTQDGSILSALFKLK